MGRGTSQNATNHVRIMFVHTLQSNFRQHWSNISANDPNSGSGIMGSGSKNLNLKRDHF